MSRTAALPPSVSRLPTYVCPLCGSDSHVRAYFKWQFWHKTPIDKVYSLRVADVSEEYEPPDIADVWCTGSHRCLTRKMGPVFVRTRAQLALVLLQSEEVKT